MAHRTLEFGTGIRASTLLGSCFLCSGFVQYGPGGDLQYCELFLAALARAEGRFGITLPLIWVDSSASLEGGRALWGIPKQQAAFDLEDGKLRAQVSGKSIASASFAVRQRLFRRVSTRAVVMQARDSKVVRTPVHVSAEVERILAQWYIPQGSPLSILRERVPLISLRFSQARIRFGA